MRTFAIIAFALLAHSTLACGQFCATCSLNNTCQACYKSLALNGTCVQTNNTQGCLIHEPRQDRCGFCDEHHVLDERRGKCVRLNQTIPNCAVSFGFRNETLCVACKNGTFPAPEGKRCVAYNTTDLPNCLWATRRITERNGTKAECFRCKGSLSIFRGQCGGFNATGCLAIEPHFNGTRICGACNVFNGYYQRDPGALNCQKRNGTNTTAVAPDFDGSQNLVDSLKSLFATAADRFGNGF